MADRTIKVTLKVDDQFSVVLTSYNTALGNAETASKNLDETNKNTTSGLDRFNSLLKAGVAIWGVKQSFGIIENFTALGQEVHKTRAVFESLAGDVATAETRLRALQDATSGIVDDQTLMSAANKFSQMGLANTTEDMAKFTEMAVKLGSSMNKGPTESLENFALMLANQSILRLDTFGISGAAVRDRMNELAEETKGMSKEARFLQAVLEQGTDAMGRLGDSVDVGATSLARMQAELKNTKNELAEAAAGGVELGAAMAETAGAIATGSLSLEEFGMAIGGASSEEIRAHMDDRLNLLDAEKQKYMDIANTGEYALQLWNASSKGFFALTGTEEGTERLQDILRSMDTSGKTPKFGIDVTGDEARIAYELWEIVTKQEAAQQGVNVATEAWQTLVQGVATLQSGEIVPMTEETRDALQEAAEAEAERLEKMKTYTDYLDIAKQATTLGMEKSFKIGGEVNIRDLDQMREYAEQLRDNLEDVQELHAEGIISDADLFKAEKLADTIDGLVKAGEALGRSKGETAFGGYSELFDAAKELFESDAIRDFGGIDMFSQGTVDALDKWQTMLDSQLSDLETMNEQGFITDDEVQRAREMADEIGRMKNEAQAARDAINSMSLDQLLGREGGGVTGEISDAVYQALQDAGLGEDVLAGFQEQFALGTGRETMFGKAFEDTIVPLLADVATSVGGQEAIDAMNRVEAAIKEGRLSGMTDEQLIESVSLAVGYKIDEKTGALTPMSMGEQYGMEGAGGMFGALMNNLGFGDFTGLLSGLTGGSTGEAAGRDLTGETEAQDMIAGAMERQADSADTLMGYFETIGGMGDTITGLGEKFLELVSPIDDASTQTDALNTKLDNLNGKSVTVDILLSTSAKDQLAALIKQMIRSEGGTAPGTIPGAGR